MLKTALRLRRLEETTASFQELVRAFERQNEELRQRVHMCTFEGKKNLASLAALTQQKESWERYLHMLKVRALWHLRLVQRRTGD